MKEKDLETVSQDLHKLCKGNNDALTQSGFRENLETLVREDLDKDLAKAADLGVAEKYRSQNCFQKIIEENRFANFGIWETELSEIGEFSLGLELYFWLVKWMAFAFFMISCGSVYVIYRCKQGEGIDEDTSGRWDAFSVANLNIVLNEEDLSKNRSVLMSIFLVDSICSIFLLVCILAFRLKSCSIVCLYNEKKLSLAEFAVEVEGIPQFAAEQEAVENHFSRFGEVHEVIFAKQSEGAVFLYLKRGELMRKIWYYEGLDERGKDVRKKLESLSKEMKDISCAIEKFESSSGKTHEELPTIKSFVLFERIISKNRCLSAYNSQKSCFNISIPENLRFLGKFRISVRETDEPQNINFLNLEVSSFSSQTRTILSYFIIASVLALSVILANSLKLYKNTLPQDIQCSLIDGSQNYLFAKSYYLGKIDPFCWCKKQGFKGLKLKEVRHYCSYYIHAVSTIVLIRTLIIIGRVINNFLLRGIIKKLAKFEKFSSKSKEKLAVMNRVFFTTFLNTALVTLVVNADFSIEYWPEFKDLSRTWYLEVGSTIVSTMIIHVFFPSWFQCFFLHPLAALKRMLGVRFCVSQAEANNRFAGKELDLSIKNAFVLKVIFCCYIYSAGMPILNVVCFVCLFSLFWTNKVLVLRYYAKPAGDWQVLNSQVLRLLPVAVIFHSAFGLYIYGSSEIFPYTLGKKNTLLQKISSFTGIVSIFIIILAISSYFWMIFIRRIVKVFSHDLSESELLDRYLSCEKDKVKNEEIYSYYISKNSEYSEAIDSINRAAQNFKEKNR